MLLVLKAITLDSPSSKTGLGISRNDRTSTPTRNAPPSPAKNIQIGKFSSVCGEFAEAFQFELA